MLQHCNLLIGKSIDAIEDRDHKGGVETMCLGPTSLNIRFGHLDYMVCIEEVNEKFVDLCERLKIRPF